MTRATLIRFIAAVLLIAGAAHVTSAILVSAGLKARYQRRIFDVRRWSDDAVTNLRLVGSYLNEHIRRDRPMVVFAGSSVTYGHLWDDRLTFASLFAERRPAAAVLNVSIIAADVSAVNDWIVCAAKRNDIRIDTLVIELPVINSVTQLAGVQRAGHQPIALQACDRPEPDPGFTRVALATRRGLGWLRILWDNQGRETIERHLEIQPVPKGYFTPAADFTAVKPVFVNQVIETLSRARTVSDTVYAFPSPVYVAGLREIGEDTAAVEEQIRVALAACASVAGVRCVDPAALLTTPGYYYNFTHLNVAGHRAMADLLDAQITMH